MLQLHLKTSSAQKSIAEVKNAHYKMSYVHDTSKNLKIYMLAFRRCLPQNRRVTTRPYLVCKLPTWCLSSWTLHPENHSRLRHHTRVSALACAEHSPSKKHHFKYRKTVFVMLKSAFRYQTRAMQLFCFLKTIPIRETFHERWRHARSN